MAIAEAVEGLATSAAGLYYQPAALEDAHPILFHSFATSKSRQVAVAPKRAVRSQMALSPDGRYLLVTLASEVNSDLMLVENFR